MDKIEIYFSDLSEDKQKEIIEILGNNGNYDVFPIADIPIGLEDGRMFNE
jgi:hypothetical protein